MVVVSGWSTWCGAPSTEALTVRNAASGVSRWQRRGLRQIQDVDDLPVLDDRDGPSRTGDPFQHGLQAGFLQHPARAEISGQCRGYHGRHVGGASHGDHLKDALDVKPLTP